MTQQWSALRTQRWGAICRVTLAMVAALAAGVASAQQAVPSKDALKKADAKAQSESDKVFKWILINADRPKHAPEAKAPAATAAAAPAPKPVAKAREAKDEGIVEKVEPIVARNQAPLAAQKALAKNTPAVPPLGAHEEQAAAGRTGTGSAPVGQTGSLPPAAGATAQAASAPGDQLALAAPKAKAPEVPPPAADDEEDEQLQLVKQVDPEFPRFMIERLEKGAVQVRFDVNPDGSVSSPTIVKTSHPRLNEAAMAAVAQWHFKPLHHKQSGIVELKFDLTQ